MAKKTYTAEQNRTARARGFNSAEEAILFQRNRERKSGGGQRSLADRIFGGEAMAAASSIHPRVIFETITKRFKTATGQD